MNYYLTELLIVVPRTVREETTQGNLLFFHTINNVTVAKKDMEALQHIIQDIHINQQKLTSEINNLKTRYKEQ